MARLEFGRFSFDTAGQVLLDRGKTVSLTPTETALLRVLLRSRGAIVTHADLLARVWPGVHVSTGTVTRQMSRLRSRLGDTVGTASVIETVPRRGYRLMVDVRQPARDSRQPAQVSDRRSVLPIALLPLAGTTADLADLAHGLTERLIDRVSSLPDARVIGLASVLQFSGRNAAPADVLSRLSAASVMTGTLRVNGDDLVVSLELIASDLTRVWSCREQVPRERPHLLEARVVRGFARWFSPSVTADHIGGAPTSSARAYEQLLAGSRLARSFMSLSHVEQALASLSEAIRLDPHLAAAHLALADAHLKGRLLGESKDASLAARRSLDAVLSIDPHCAAAIAMHAVLIEETDWDRKAALDAITRAEAMAPNDPVVHFWCAAFFDRRGQFDKSLAHLDAGLATDPLSMEMLVGRICSLVKAGRHADARDQIDAMMPLMNGDIGIGVVACMAAYSYAATGRRRRAIELANRILESPLADGSAMTLAIVALARVGDIEAARAGVQALESRHTGGHVPAYFLSTVYAAIGEKDKALDLFDQAVAERSLHILYGATTPGFESIQNTPRFRAALKRIGLPT